MESTKSDNVRWNLGTESVHDADIVSPFKGPSDQAFTVEYENELVYVDSYDWRESNRLKAQIFSGLIVFIIFGLSDQTVGTLIPRLQEYYQVKDLAISLVFLSTTSGYFMMAFTSQKFQERLGMGGTCMVGTCMMLFCFLMLSLKPPYLLLLIAVFFYGCGCGSLDATLCTWAGYLLNSNQILGFLHGCYGLGCMLAPPIFTHLIEKKKNPWKWNMCYVSLMVLCAIDLVFIISTFKYETAKKYRYNAFMQSSKRNEIELSDFDESNNREDISGSEEGIDSSRSFSAVLKSKYVWVLSISLFMYVGGESAFGEWLISYTTRVKGVSYEYASYLATSYWSGVTIGRFVLGFVTAAYFTTELNATLVYVLLGAVGYGLFWVFSFFSPNFLEFVIVLVTGFFTGPIFPSTIVVSMTILPVKLHSSALGFICSFGGGGGAALNFIVGAVAQTDLGIKAFPFIIMVTFGILSLIWLGIYNFSHKTYSKTAI